MKRIFSIIIAGLISAGAFAQAPEKMSYQAVVRDGSNTLVTSSAVGMQISILQGSSSGTAVYVETQTPTSNANGLVSVEIGDGTLVSGDFSTIDWANGPYFVKTETDPTGGVTYTITGTSQLLSVPYALHAKTAENVVNDAVNDADADPNNEIQSISRSGTTVTLSNGGGSFQDSVGVYTQGTGVNITNNVISTTTACGLAIGDTYQGGIIFYLDASGCHGLISAPTDQNTSINWYNGAYTNTTAFSNCVGCGDGNTTMIIYNQGNSGSYAAKICNDLSLGGYVDWYLPSKYELNLMYKNIGLGNTLGLGNIGGFAPNFYWSSTEEDDSNAWRQGFASGPQGPDLKNVSSYVRAVRAF